MNKTIDKFKNDLDHKQKELQEKDELIKQLMDQNKLLNESQAPIPETEEDIDSMNQSTKFDDYYGDIFQGGVETNPKDHETDEKGNYI